MAYCFRLLVLLTTLAVTGLVYQAVATRNDYRQVANARHSDARLL